MPYIVQPWIDGVTSISAAKLNYIEAGILAAIPKDLVDAKGDILAATAADTVARLAVGSNGQVLTADSAQATGVKWATVATTHELAYNQYTSPVSVTATTEGTANTVVTASSVTYDGTAVMIEFYSPRVLTATASDAIVDFVLRDDTAGASIGLLGRVRGSASAGNVLLETATRLATRITPSAGARVYSIRAFVNTGTGTVGGAAGGIGAVVPGFIRITRAA